ncbi:MAG TPA: cation diffusion facilitator family transporter [Chromatiaceae bacterium]|nr:cation diffusion facilitator family transporter [Chromatiaceae bacterium]
MSHSSKKAVITAIVSNALVTVIKFIASVLSGSASMANEAVHSLMDTLNQGFLFLGLRESEKPADTVYAFGHGQKKYLWNLWSAIGLFSIGAGLGLSHAWHSWEGLGNSHIIETTSIMGYEISALWLNLSVLGIGFILEGYSFLVALKEFLSRMRAQGEKNPIAYLLKADDPTLTAIVLEDSAAMLGLTLAALGIILTAMTGHAEYDIIFSALIAIMLGGIAFYLGFINMRFLADMRDMEAEYLFQDIVEDHPELERYHDLRSIIIDEQNTVLVAEIELKEEAMVNGLQQKINDTRDHLLHELGSNEKQREQLKQYALDRAAVEVIIGRAEHIIDEIEQDIRARLPRVSHITLEVEGVCAGKTPSLAAAKAHCPEESTPRS